MNAHLDQLEQTLGQQVAGLTAIKNWLPRKLELIKGHRLQELEAFNAREEEQVTRLSQAESQRQVLLGLLAEDFAAAGTVWASITAYGRDEENALRVGFGDDVAAGAGLVAWTSEGPRAVGDALGDPLTGIAAAAAVVEQLAAGRGAVLDVSMHDVCSRVAAGIASAGT